MIKFQSGRNFNELFEVVSKCIDKRDNQKPVVVDFRNREADEILLSFLNWFMVESERAIIVVLSEEDDLEDYKQKYPKLALIKHSQLN